MGDWTEGMEAALKLPSMSNEEAAELCHKAQAGDQDAMDKVVSHHTKLALHMATTYAKWARHKLLFDDQDELFSVALEVLLRSVQKYDSTKVPFMAWAGLQMRFYLYNAVTRTSPAVQFPDNEDRLPSTEFAQPSQWQAGSQHDAMRDLDSLLVSGMAQGLITQKQCNLVREYSHSLSYWEVEQTLGLKRGSACKEIDPALEALSRMVAEEEARSAD